MLEESTSGGPSEPHRWLEESTPEREAWLKMQHSRTEAMLERISIRGGLRARLQELLKVPDERFMVSFPGGDGELQWRRSNVGDSPQLWGISDEHEVMLLDPGSWPKSQRLGWTTFSRGSQFLAYCRIDCGRDQGHLEVIDLCNGELIHSADKVDAIRAPDWTSDDDRLIYCSIADSNPGLFAFSALTGAIAKLSSHYVGPYDQVAAYGGTVVYTTPTREYDSAEIRLARAGDDRRLEGWQGRMSFCQSGPQLYILTNDQAPFGQILSFDLERGEQLEPFVPEREGSVLEEVAVCGLGVAVSFQEESLPGIAVYGKDGEEVFRQVASTPGKFSGMEDDGEGGLLYSWSSLTSPPSLIRLSADGLNPETLAEEQIPGFEPSKYTTQRLWYHSEDGTRVPLTLGCRHSLERDGENPVHIVVYGGFGRSMDAEFSATAVPFMEAGGVYAIAHIRGGGEMGSEWHKQVKGTRRFKVYEDVKAAAEYLIAEGYTKVDKLSLEGSSNGGLVVGVVTNKWPGLFRTAVINSGVLDLVNFEELGGACWNQEYGTMEAPGDSEFLRQNSPLHNLPKRDLRTSYLITTGTADDRVNPAHSYKFVEALHTRAEGAAFLRLESKVGHEQGLEMDALVHRYADQWAFILEQATVP